MKECPICKCPTWQPVAVPEHWICPRCGEHHQSWDEQTWNELLARLAIQQQEICDQDIPRQRWKRIACELDLLLACAVNDLRGYDLTEAMNLEGLRFEIMVGPFGPGEYGAVCVAMCPRCGKHKVDSLNAGGRHECTDGDSGPGLGGEG